MENLFDKLSEDSMKFDVKFSDDVSCHFMVTCSKIHEKRMPNYFDTLFDFEATCFDKDGREAGDICFDITDPDALHIEDVEVLYAFRHHGYGAKMLHLAEFVAYQYGLNKVDGLFAPEDEDKAKKFYNNNGYRVIKKDGTICISKKLIKSQKYEDVIVENFARYLPEEEIEI